MSNYQGFRLMEVPLNISENIKGNGRLIPTT